MLYDELEEERRQRHALEERIEANQQRVEADRLRSEQMFQWMQNLSARMGEPLPPALFPTPRPEVTPVSINVYCFRLYMT
jgi:hypothetical protein